MAMTQERADEISYLICVREFLRYCDIEGVTVVTAEDFHRIMEKGIVNELLEDIPALKTEEAAEYLQFIFMDVQNALAKRNIPHKNKDSADKAAFIDGVKLRGDPY